MSTFWYIWFLFGLTLVQLFSTDHIQISALNVESNLNDHSSENSILGIVDDEDGLTDQICGTHPLKTILRKIAHAQPDMDQQAVVRLLALMRVRAPKLWNSYQQMLAAYVNCKVMSAGGSLG
uniref:Uncharacterized protein n=1 Tax=Panagrolaimus sp. JU765 TaxID=591449 RepID=A0AC34PW24_9BILA